VGIRPGEKLHEEMITETDGLNTLEFANQFVMVPAHRELWDPDEYCRAFNGKRCEYGFRYHSGSNTDWLSVEQLRELIRTQVDPTFTV
jgi:FlaA1/EpsC-like NDP-sugar epimerase